MIRIDDVHSINCIAHAAKVQFVPHFHHCIADYDQNDILKGGALFTDWNRGSILIHLAGFRPNWVSKALLYLGFHYPFVELGVKKVFGLVPESNVTARNVNLHLGFKIEILLADVFPGEEYNGMYIMSMYAKDCRFLKMKPPLIALAPGELTSKILPMGDQFVTRH